LQHPQWSSKIVVDLERTKKNFERFLKIFLNLART